MDSISCEEIFRMTQQVWTPMLSFPIKLKPERPTGTAMGGESVVGSVSLNGDWQGAVTLEFSQRLACLCAGQIFGMEAEEAESEDIHDAVGELANQVGGLIKGRLAPKSLLGLPTITEGTDLLIDVPRCQPLGSATMDCQGAEIRIEVWKLIPDS